MSVVSVSYRLDLLDKPIAINTPAGLSEKETHERYERSLDLFNIGHNLEDEGEIEKAMNFYTEAIQANPNMSMAYLRRGKIYLDKNLFQEALADFFSYRNQQPNCSRVLLYLARLSNELWINSGDDFHKNNSKRYLDWAIQKNELYGIFRFSEN